MDIINSFLIDAHLVSDEDRELLISRFMISKSRKVSREDQLSNSYNLKVTGLGFDGKQNLDMKLQANSSGNKFRNNQLTENISVINQTTSI